MDGRSGEIRDRATNAWLLAETLQAMTQIAQPLVQKFVRTLRRYQDQLLTFLDWTAERLCPYQQRLAAPCLTRANSRPSCALPPRSGAAVRR